MIKLLLHESKRRVGSPGVFITPGTYFMKFSSIRNVFPPALVAKLVFKGCCFGYLWTGRDQNLYLRSNLTIQVIDQPHFIS